jgi:hypothetical protein
LRIEDRGSIFNPRSSELTPGFAQGRFSIAEASDGEKVVARDMTMAPLQKGPGVTQGDR